MSLDTRSKLKTRDLELAASLCLGANTHLPAPLPLSSGYYCGDTGKSRAVVKRTHKEERAVVVNEPTCEQ